MSLHQSFLRNVRPAGPRQPALVAVATSQPAWPFVAFTSRPQGAPWWAMLISGLGLGTAVALVLRLLAWWRNYQRFQALRQLRVREASNGSDATAPSAAPSAARLAELVASLKSHAEETREATASLRRSVEQQQRLYQVAATDFQRKLDEASKRRSLGLRMEVAPESLQLLRSLVTCKQGAPRIAKENGDGCLNNEADAALQGLLRSGSAADVKRSLQTLSMILQNLTAHPTQEKYKEVNASSLRFRETFEGDKDGAVTELLKLAGFERQGDCFKWLTGRPMAEAERIRDLLRDALRDERYKGGGNTGAGEVASGGRKEEEAMESIAPWASSVVQQQLSKRMP